jgi:Ni,Fe-hydrogenase III component G
MPVSKARANKFYIYIMYLYCLFICIKTDYRDNTSDYAVHIFLLYKSNKTIWMFFGKFADERDNQVNYPNIYNEEGDNRL